ncbi:MAG: transporter substrate-binding domain-containing protein, partial [Caldilineaceae bacterium]|nr:transporter substrate-binding domain-containing protein [Caldilineaceae bacterium]
GRRLNIEVVFKDFAFEGLLDALHLNQVDAAIAAISITSGREQAATFTQIYYVGEDAILARADDPLSNIQIAREMAGRRVGVQNGSVYEAWVQQNLVDTRLITTEQMQQYGDLKLAVADLKANRVDLVMLDAAPAQSFVQGEGVKVAGEGLVEQRYAIALPEGDDSVAVNMNRVLTELQNDGVLAQLVEQYLTVAAEEVIVPPTPAPPTATPIPTEEPIPTATTTPLPPTLTPIPPCVDGMSYVLDINLDDHGMTAPPVLSPSQGFTKGWRLQNSGTCAWDAAFSLVYIGGNTGASQMGGQPVTVG